MNRTTLFILVLAFLACFFGWETYRAWTMPVLPADGSSPTEAFSLPSSAEPPQGALGEDLSGALASVLGRPVFRPDRRPHVQEDSGPSARRYETELARFTVLGVLMLEDVQKALVVGKGAGERWEVGEGDELPGFAVKAITPDGLVLAADGRQFVLPLYAGAPKGTGGSLRTEVAPPSQPAPKPSPAQRPGMPPVPQVAPVPQPARPNVPPRPAYLPGTAPGTPPQEAGKEGSEIPRKIRRRWSPPGR